MSNQAHLESPLVGFRLAERQGADASKAGVSAAERPFLGYLNLRGDAGQADFVEAAKVCLGLNLPQEPNTFVENDALLVYWLAFDEWLIVTAPEAEAELAERLRKALAGQHAAVTDVSSGQTSVLMSGADVRDLLAKGCPLDLHPRVFGPGRCAQTVLARGGMLIRQLDETPTFELVLRRSFADYLWLWLEDAAQEYGLAIVEAERLLPKAGSTPLAAQA